MTRPTTASTTTASTTRPTNSIDDNGVDVTTNSIDDNGVDVTTNSIDDSTSNSVEDISGPCDEAEHANDPRCTGGAAAPATSVDDNSAHGGGVDDSGHHNGGDDSGHGGSDG